MSFVSSRIVTARDEKRGHNELLAFAPGLGSTTQLASSTGSVTDSYLYDSFGNILLTSGSTTNWFRYVGRLGYYYDVDLAEYKLRARILDPATGRFPNRDPMGFSGGDA